MIKLIEMECVEIIWSRWKIVTSSEVFMQVE